MITLFRFIFFWLVTVPCLSCYTLPDVYFTRQVRIKVVGDLMCHNSQISTYYFPKTKQYDSSGSFEYVSNLLQDADLTLGNLETTIATDPIEFTGYPRFGSPIGYLTGIQNSGFDILSTANNHSADKGPFGIDHTIDSVIQKGMVPIGTFKSNSDYLDRKDFFIEVNGIKIAIYNYTYSTNGIPVKNGRTVRLLDENQIKEDVVFAKESGIHFVILWYHYGSEYEEKPDKSQTKWVNLGFEAGADIIIGGHPHVVQRIDQFQEEKTWEDRLVAYSLGNFLSAQNRENTDGGIILSFELEINSRNQKKIKNVITEPVWVYSHGYKIIPILKYARNEISLKLPKHLEKRMYGYEAHLKKIPGLTF
ncbi:CapA family protein [Leptospira kanakyensis]|uniref:CapA family protein n=1 Tax=Leptospira kanakyensis TaxID=2484968 RepID=A0A6N4PZE9_9LEPT|nr:CapA family protein [Leptospira kanakyensis]MCW7469162.1 CapA family protein [Leptospira kanakyensis]MCW7480151.1 CapA family protein [Leptospira kanakyensis]TGK50359.1 CapA family protein [Leptospira kanakyensis]TGK64038.1 CapA family protein [Leptospira kanakyensis]TGK69499.1 CapA family protein [Leptospira kanakyensis]